MSRRKDSIATGSYKSYEGILSSIGMFLRLSMIIVGILFILQCGIIYLLYNHDKTIFTHGFKDNELCILKAYISGTIRDKILPNPFNNNNVTVFCPCWDDPKEKVNWNKFKKMFGKTIEETTLPALKKNILSIVFYTSFIYLIYFGIMIYLWRDSVKKSRDKFLRGAKIIAEKQLIQRLKETNPTITYRINPALRIPEKYIAGRNLCLGQSGSGKSQLMYRIIEQLIQRDVKCIIHDFKGDFVQIFLDRSKHLIFNPLDKRHLNSDIKESKIRGWTVFNDIKTLPDVESFAASMIPDSGKEPYWIAAPRDILKSILIYCIQTKKTTNDELLKLLIMNPLLLKKTLEPVEGCEVGLQHLEDPKLSGQLKSIMASYTATLSYLRGTDGNFSIRQWIKDPESEHRIIYLQNNTDVQDTLKTLLTTFFDISTKALLSLSDDPHSPGRKVYFILDEFSQLSKMPSVVQLLTQCRSKGGAAWIMSQDLSAIEAIYGQHATRTIVNNCGNKWYFAVNDEQGADFISKDLGSVQVERTKSSKSFGAQDLKESISTNSEIVEERIVMPSQVATQPTLSFYLKLTDLPVTQTKLDYIKYDDTRAEKYVYRELSFSNKPVFDVAEATSIRPEEGTGETMHGLQNEPVKGPVVQEAKPVEDENYEPEIG